MLDWLKQAPRHIHDKTYCRHLCRFFTSVAIHQLAAKGLLNTSEPVSPYSKHLAGMQDLSEMGASGMCLHSPPSLLGLQQCLRQDLDLRCKCGAPAHTFICEPGRSCCR